MTPFSSATRDQHPLLLHISQKWNELVSLTTLAVKLSTLHSKSKTLFWQLLWLRISDWCVLTADWDRLLSPTLSQYQDGQFKGLNISFVLWAEIWCESPGDFWHETFWSWTCMCVSHHDFSTNSLIGGFCQQGSLGRVVVSSPAVALDFDFISEDCSRKSGRTVRYPVVSYWFETGREKQTLFIDVSVRRCYLVTTRS